MEETISLRELFQTLKKRFWLIAIIAVLATAVSGIVSYFVLTPVYQASTQLLVNQSKSDQPVFNTNEIQTNLQLINTYNVIIKSPAILNLVIEDLDLAMSTEALNGKITVGSEQNSQVVLITVQDPDAFMAADIANTVASVFQREISNIMNVDNVSILAKSEVKENPAPVKPQPTLNMAIALVVGLMLGVGLSFLLEYLDNTIKNEQDIEKLLELPVLGAITTMTEEAKGKKANNKMSDVRGETVGS
ncbi:Wzz/FepE/Etk N-terminal domain-containing protein [Cytobacillus sp. S13-E01]|uniref:YveK family protein n=1 Tax=Cytobacillus sp. S13-E01 TaxID=3031326 RepID=UPI0023D8BB47|nr:Wzz/FepE/Etk N-terminal domain-containing protein [Cytobacillus sp. S13-E01]MDF0727048.1 Wzz/FepE/Etk N-terminal domain-containing protein [Cytobacillus sp. S13-E01]